MSKKTTDIACASLVVGAGLVAAALGIAVQSWRDERARRLWRWSAEDGKPGLAVVTGASSGIGKSYALYLAERGHDLVLIARREERLRAVAAQVGQQFGVAAEVITADLANAPDLERVATRIEQLDNIELLVNNAGFGITEPFARSEAAKQIDMIELHVIATTRLTRAALTAMLLHHHGAIINVSSLAGFLALPNNANYSATKSFLNVFSETLHYELRGTGVRVQALCPGFTHTGFHDEPANLDRRQIPAFLWMQADKVVAESLDALTRDRTIYVPGRKNRLIAVLSSSLLVSELVGNLMR